MIECVVMPTVDVESCALLTSSTSSALHVGGFARPLIASVWLLMLRVIGGVSLAAAVMVFGRTPLAAGMIRAERRATLAILRLVLYLESGSLSA